MLTITVYFSVGTVLQRKLRRPDKVGLAVQVARQMMRTWLNQDAGVVKATITNDADELLGVLYPVGF